MNRIYNGVESNSARYFYGKEVEHTKFFGAPTLFIVGGDLNYKEIIERSADVDHIFIGANHSLNQLSLKDLVVIRDLMDFRFSVTIDGDAETVTTILKLLETYKEQICGIIQLKISDVNSIKNNVYVKVTEDLDDMQTPTNSGVWVTPLSDMISSDNLTTWDKYSNDTL